MPAAAAESNSIAVQPVGRLGSVKCPTRMPATSVSDPVNAVWAVDAPLGIRAPAATVHPNARRVITLNRSDRESRIPSASLHRERSRVDRLLWMVLSPVWSRDQILRRLASRSVAAGL